MRRPKTAPEIVAPLSDGLLLALTNAAIHEVVERGLELPALIGETAMTEVKHQPTKLINPWLEPEPLPPSVLADGRIIIEHDPRHVRVDGRLAKITGKQYSLIALVGANADMVVDYPFIMQAIWGQPLTNQTDIAPRKINTTLSRTRQELGREDLGHRVHGAIRAIFRQGLVGLSSLPPRLSEHTPHDL